YYRCLVFVIWAVIVFYVPSFWSMGRYFGLCAFVLFYVPSSRSMCHYLVLWTVISILWAFASIHSMDRHLRPMNRHPPTDLLAVTPRRIDGLTSHDSSKIGRHYLFHFFHN